MSDWQALDLELGKWRAAGRTAELWWRDDDAANTSPELDRLLALHRETAVPLALERLFGNRPLGVMVPPCNRIAPALVPTLPEIGFTGLSTFGARPRAQPVRGLRQINTHVDLVDWKSGGGFTGEEACLAILVASLARARRESGEPVGILSHHLAMDDGAWDFLRSFWERTKAMSDLRVRSAHQLFAAGSSKEGEARV